MITRSRDGGTWRIGTNAEVAWIAEATSQGRTITTAIPPVFEAYATILVAYGDGERGKHDAASRGGWGIWTPASMTSSSPARRW